MEYSITNFNKETGQIVVRFAPNMEPLLIEVPIENGVYITGENLDNYIKGFIPSWHLERLAAIKAGVPNEAEIQCLVIQEQISPTETDVNLELMQQISQSSMENDIAFVTDIVNSILAEKGL